MKKNKSIAIIGSGISGIFTAYLLDKKHNVTLFEANATLGGHSNTVHHDGRDIDTGFIVFNDLNYPNFTRFLHELNVKHQDSDMSFGFYNSAQPFWWCSDIPFGVFSQKRNLISSDYWHFLSEIKRFNTSIKKDLHTKRIPNESLETYLEQYNFSDSFKNHYIFPMGAAIWSCPISQICHFPARAFFEFWNNHRLLNVTDRPTWKTVRGGSRRYLDAFEAQFSGHIKLNHPILSIQRNVNTVTIRTPNSSQEFDHVVIATHADQALAILSDPNKLETELLSQWHYSKNRVDLHHDSKIMPPRKSGWASWLVHQNQTTQALSMTYYMNRLQKLNASKNYFVTLNDEGTIQPSTIIKTINYTHPIFTAHSLSTQSRLKELQTNLTSYCGSYFGYGFHEDGARSAVNVAHHLGVNW